MIGRGLILCGALLTFLFVFGEAKGIDADWQKKANITVALNEEDSASKGEDLAQTGLSSEELDGLMKYAGVFGKAQDYMEVANPTNNRRVKRNYQIELNPLENLVKRNIVETIFE